MSVASSDDDDVWALSSALSLSLSEGLRDVENRRVIGLGCSLSVFRVLAGARELGLKKK